jgi:hypothetical protein
MALFDSVSTVSGEVPSSQKLKQFANDKPIEEFNDYRGNE